MDVHSCDKHSFLFPDISPIMLQGQLTQEHNLCGNTVFMIAQGSIVEVDCIITDPLQAQVVISVGSFAQVIVRLIFLFAPQVDLQMKVIMCGAQTKVTILSMCAGQDDQKITLQTEQIHCGPANNSELILQAILQDRAKLQYDGTIRIEKDAAGSYASQKNTNILCSHKAVAISIPNIEVLHHQVQCYHAAATGKFDQEQMMYLQSRGLAQQQVYQLLVQAFYAPVLEGYEKKDSILQKIYETL